MSAQRVIPSSHTGSLPRPDDLIKLMFAVNDGIPVDRDALDAEVVRSIEHFWFSIVCLPQETA